MLRPKAFPPEEDLVAAGAYGDEFIILLTGSLRVVDTARARAQAGAGAGASSSAEDNIAIRPSSSAEEDNVVRVVQDSDREPIVGLAACLAEPQLKRVKTRTDGWTVKAGSFCDTVWVRRKAFQQCLVDHWPEGREEMIQLAYFQYDVASLEAGGADGAEGEASAEEIEEAPQMLFPIGLTEFAESKSDESESNPFEQDEAVVAAVEVGLLEGDVVRRKLHSDVDTMKSDIQELKDSNKHMAEMLELLVRQVTNPDRGRARRR